MSEAVKTPSLTGTVSPMIPVLVCALAICLLAIRWGSHLTLVPNPRDFQRFIEVLKRRPFHIFPGVNTLFNALMQHPQFRSIDFSQLVLARRAGWRPPKERRASGKSSPAARWSRPGSSASRRRTWD